MQNSGVAVTATALHQSSNNEDPVLSDTTYFRRIANIWEMDYVGFKVPVFDCNWVNNVGGVYIEESGFVRVDLAKVGYKDDSFIMATQAQQVFYVTDPVDKKWIMTSGSNGTSETNGTNGSGITEKISKRGIVNMLKVKKVRTKGIVQKVIWNEIGQPIGKESVTLAFFIGSYARRNIPISCNDWCKKEWNIVKQNLWDEIKFRTNLRILVKDKHGNYSAEPPALYAHFSSVAPYWKEFIENAMKEDFVIKKKIDAGEKNHVVTRLDAWEYARSDENDIVKDPATLQVLEDVVVTISQKLGEHELTNIGTDDLLARLIPLENSGRVRAVGWGVTKTSLQTTSKGSELSKLKNDVAFLINEIRELKSKGYNPGMQSGGSSHMDNFDMNDDGDGEHDHYDPVLVEDLPQGKNACYLYVDPGHRYVGRGILHNDQNDRTLHGIPLEEGYVRVHFEVAEKSELKTPLPRSCDEANLVGEAPGYFLAWPRKLVSMKMEETPKTMNKKKITHAKGHKKFEEKQKEKTVESVVDVSSKQLGYPLPQDVCHDLAFVFDRVIDIQVEIGPYWNGEPWIEHINNENVPEVLNSQWLSATSIIFYIRLVSILNIDVTSKSFLKMFLKRRRMTTIAIKKRYAGTLTWAAFTLIAFSEMLWK
ncbi:hypothetical protein AgCh_039222 [Apium graveolens]